MSKKDASRSNFKGNTLEQAYTKIYFEDLFEVPTSLLKAVKEIAEKNGMSSRKERYLFEKDFIFHDLYSFIKIPEKYFEEKICWAFTDEKMNKVLEVSQFFINIRQIVEKESYGGYEQEQLNILKEVFSLPELKDVKILRVSINKADQILNKDINGFGRYFESNLLQLDLTNDILEVNKSDYQSKMTINSSNKDRMINIIRFIDTYGEEDDLIFRLLILVETYKIYEKPTDVRICEVLEDLNNLNFEIFISFLTEEGYEILKRGETINGV